MSQFKKSSAYRLTLIAVAAAALAGCSSDKGIVNDTAHAADMQQSVNAVKNNPNIPEQAKAQIIAAIQQRASGSAPQH